MSRPLRVTEAAMQEILQSIAEKLLSTNVLTKKVHLDYEMKKDDDKAYLDFTPSAYIKMHALVADFDSEVAWHGTVKRIDEKHFQITDILVYPQEVSGATVNTDQEGYQTWLYGLDDETFNTLRFQGHSHVNMSTTPSSVDENHQSEIVEQLGNTDFYIFMIVNKKDEYHAWIYDGTTDKYFDTDDIELTIGGLNPHLVSFIKDAKDLVKPKYSSYGKSKGKAKSKWEEEDDYFSNYYKWGAQNK